MQKLTDYQVITEYYTTEESKMPIVEVKNFRTKKEAQAYKNVTQMAIKSLGFANSKVELREHTYTI